MRMRKEAESCHILAVPLNARCIRDTVSAIGDSAVLCSSVRRLHELISAMMAEDDGKKGNTLFQKWERQMDLKNSQCLGHSNWTICSPFSPFCPENFPSFSLSYWEGISYYPRGPIMGKGNSLNSKIGWYIWNLMPGAFKLDHLQSFQPILSWKFSIFFTFILGRHFLLPQRANNGKWEFTQLQMESNAWGIQTGPFAVHLAHFVLKIFHLFHFHTGEPFLITPDSGPEGQSNWHIWILTHPADDKWRISFAPQRAQAGHDKQRSMIQSEEGRREHDMGESNGRSPPPCSQCSHRFWPYLSFCCCRCRFLFLILSRARSASFGFWSRVGKQRKWRAVRTRITVFSLKVSG